LYQDSTRKSTVKSVVSSSRKSIFVFGNDIRIKSPFRVGNAYTFCFINRKPLFMIGPNCIF
jgi:hypothetical protein